MVELRRWLPLLLPVVLLEWGLMLAALIDLVQRPRTKGPKWAWVLVIVIVNIVGPIFYFLFGREE